jgi:hypothetical protein
MYLSDSHTAGDIETTKRAFEGAFASL